MKTREQFLEMAAGLRKRIQGMPQFSLMNGAIADLLVQVDREAREECETSAQGMREALLWLYQLAGAARESVEHLDNLSAALRGEPAPNAWGPAGNYIIDLEQRVADVRTRTDAAEARVQRSEAALKAWDRFAAECRQRNVIVPLWASLLNERAVELMVAALAPEASAISERTAEQIEVENKARSESPFDYCSDCGRKIQRHELHGTTAEPCAVRPHDKPIPEASSAIDGSGSVSKINPLAAGGDPC